MDNTLPIYSEVLDTEGKPWKISSGKELRINPEYRVLVYPKEQEVLFNNDRILILILLFVEDGVEFQKLNINDPYNQLVLHVALTLYLEEKVGLIQFGEDNKPVSEERLLELTAQGQSPYGFATCIDSKNKGHVFEPGSDKTDRLNKLFGSCYDLLTPLGNEGRFPSKRRIAELANALRSGEKEGEEAYQNEKTGKAKKGGTGASCESSEEETEEGSEGSGNSEEQEENEETQKESGEGSSKPEESSTKEPLEEEVVEPAREAKPKKPKRVTGVKQHKNTRLKAPVAPGYKKELPKKNPPGGKPNIPYNGPKINEKTKRDVATFAKAIDNAISLSKEPIGHTLLQKHVYQAAEQGIIAYGDGDFGNAAIVDVPLSYVPRRMQQTLFRKGKAFRDSGSIPSRFDRYSTGNIFAGKGRSNYISGATILIDYSGSTGLVARDVLQVVMFAPFCTISIYHGCAGRGPFIPPLGKKADGLVLTIGKNGRMANLESYECCRSNEIDGPAIKWLSTQRGPRFYVGDLQFTGTGDGGLYKHSPEYQDAINVILQKDIIYVRNVEELKKLLFGTVAELEHHKAAMNTYITTNYAIK